MRDIARGEALELLNAPDRLKNLQMLVDRARNGELPMPEPTGDVNNHIHTTYSFSPYSPAAAVWFAWRAGLCTAGLMDHDSIAGADEFLAACEICGIGGTIGIELRLNMAGTPFADRRINNPDQNGCMYTAMHAVPHNMAPSLNALLQPRRDARNARNRRMVDAINALLGRHGIAIDFDRDVLPLSEFARGGTVTERHISRALSQRMIDVTGGGRKLVDFIKTALNLPIPAKIEALILEADNPHRVYDLLGWIKSELIGQFYVPADGELLSVSDFIELSESIHAISAHAYLGDVVGASITGDKRTQSFEDGYLDALLRFSKDSGYRSLTFAPSRNTPGQVARIRALCGELGFMTISGEDINSPRQSFVCVAQRDPSFADLTDAAWALIAHERLAAESFEKGLFSASSERQWPDIARRVKAFAEMGRALCGQP